MLKSSFVMSSVVVCLLCTLLSSLPSVAYAAPRLQQTVAERRAIIQADVAEDLATGAAAHEKDGDLEGASSFGYGYYSYPYLGGYYGGYYPSYYSSYYGIGYPYYGGYYGGHGHGYHGHGYHGHYF